MKTEELRLKKIGKKYKIRWVKNRLNAVKKWLIGTQVKISVRGRLQNLPGLKQQYFVLRGRKSRHSPKVVELVTRTGCKFHRGTSRRRMLYMGRAKGECPYLILCIECPLFLMCITNYISSTDSQQYISIQQAKTDGSPTASLQMQHEPLTSARQPRPRVRTAFPHEP